MKLCKSCGANENGKIMTEHFKGGYICNDCIGSFFTCPDCGLVFNHDDYEWGQTEKGYCRICSNKHTYNQRASM